VGYNASIMTNRFSHFEDHIQRLIEGGFARLFAGRLHPREVAIQLAKAMEDRAQDDRLAPDMYTVRLNPQDHEAILSAQPDLPVILAHELTEIARVGGFTLATFPDVKLLSDINIGLKQVEIKARHSTTRREVTEALPVPTYEIFKKDAPKATLIVNGERHIPLDRPVINLGRHRDNHIILEDPSVSRHHAQIRLRFKKFVLFDLGSSRGTRVNENRVQEAVLESGDVIVLGNTSLLYIEENVQDSDDTAGTSPHNST
jgi:hypothetical protein